MIYVPGWDSCKKLASLPRKTHDHIPQTNRHGTGNSSQDDWKMTLLKATLRTQNTHTHMRACACTQAHTHALNGIKNKQWAFVEVSVLVQCIITGKQSNAFKGMLLSKDIICIKFFLYKQKWLFCWDGYLWLYCCMNNLNISHRSHIASTNRFCALGSMLISRFGVTSWFYSVSNSVTRLVNLEKIFTWTWTTSIRLHCCPNVQISCRKIYFPIFAYKLFMVKINKKCQ